MSYLQRDYMTTGNGFTMFYCAERSCMCLCRCGDQGSVAPQSKLLDTA